MAFLKLPDNQWKRAIPPYVNKADMVKLNQKIQHLYETENVLPKQNAIFKALDLTDYQNVKVVILGQDPYPNPKNAMGMSFSVNSGQNVPKSLQNIFIERYHDLGLPPSDSGDLTAWAKQGVLLLNTVLTVRAYASSSHQNIGWEEFTDAIIKSLNDAPQPIVYFLWGRQAQAKAPLIKQTTNRLIIESSHPSPFSAHYSFFGSYPFSRANHFLAEHGAEPIDWRN